MDRVFRGQKNAAASFFSRPTLPLPTNPTAQRPSSAPVPAPSPAMPYSPPLPGRFVPPSEPAFVAPQNPSIAAFLGNQPTAPRPQPVLIGNGGSIGRPTAGMAGNNSAFISGVYDAIAPRLGDDGAGQDFLLGLLGNSFGQSGAAQSPPPAPPNDNRVPGMGMGALDPFLMDVMGPDFSGRYSFAQSNAKAQAAAEQRVAANEAKIKANDAEVAAIEAAQDAYIKDHPNWGTVPGGDPYITESNARADALTQESNALADENHRINEASKIASGDTYSGRASPDWGLNVETGLNVLDSGREAVVTNIGDSAIAAIEDGTLNNLPLPAPGKAGTAINTVGDVINWGINVIKPGAGNVVNNQVVGSYDAGRPPTNEAEESLWLQSWLISGGKERQDQAQYIYNAGYDANGDGYIDYVGGRAVWEWYMGQQPWYISATSQVIYDPFNLTIVAGGAGSELSRVAKLIDIAATTPAAKKVATGVQWTAKILETIGHADDPAYWVKAGVGRIGRTVGAKTGNVIGLLDPVTGEVIRSGEKTAVDIAKGAKDFRAFEPYVKTEVSSIPVFPPTKYGNQSVIQVGNSGTNWISQGADGTYTVYKRPEAGGQLYASATGLTYEQAVASAQQDELIYLGTLATSPVASHSGHAALYDHDAPITFTNANDGVIAYIDNGSQRVVFDQRTGTYSVQVQTGANTYATASTYNTPNEAIDDLNNRYFQTGGSQATTGGVPTMYQPRLGAATSPEVSPPTGQGAVGGTQVGGAPSNAPSPTEAAVPGGVNVGTIPMSSPEVSPGVSGQGAVGGTQVGAAPSNAPSPTEAAVPGGANVGTVPVPPRAASSPEVSPPTGEGEIGGPSRTGEVIGDATDTAAASVPTSQADGPFVTPGEATPEGAARNVERTGDRPHDMRTTDRPVDTRTGARSSDEVATSAERKAGNRTEQVLSDTPEADIPASTASAAPPASGVSSVADASPSPGMYRREITNADTGASTIDYSPPKLWSNEAIDTVTRAMPAPGEARQVVMDWIGRNPEIQRAQDELWSAMKSGDEIDQALAAMEMQATMAEQWTATGMARQYGPVSGQYVSPGAAGLDISSASFPTEFAKTGRSIERIASGRASRYDIANLRRTGVLPHESGVDPDLLRKLNRYQMDKYAASANGIPYILPDGRNRLYANQLFEGGDNLPQDLQALLNGPGLDRMLNTQRRLDGLQARFAALRNGQVADPAALDRQLDQAMGRYNVDRAVERSRGESGRVKDVDTQAQKQHASVMDEAQRSIKPGTGADAPPDIDFKAMKKSGQRRDPFNNAIPDNEGQAEFLFNGGRLREADPTLRYDIVTVTLPTNAKGVMLRSETGELIGWGKNRQQMLTKIMQERGDVPFLRVFQDGVQVPIPRNIPGPSNLRGALIKANGGQPAGGTIRVLQGPDGGYHLIVENAAGTRVAVINSYTSVDDARTAIEKAAQKGGLDWSFIGPDGKPLFEGRRGATAFANAPFDPRQAAQGAKYTGNAARNQVEALGRRLGIVDAAPVVPNPKNDGTFAGRLFDSGAIDEAEYKVLTRTYTKNGREVVAQDQIIATMIETGDLDRAIRETLDDVLGTSKLKKAEEAARKNRSSISKGWDAVNDVYRANLLYAAHRTFAATAADWIGDVAIQALNGHPLSGIAELAADIGRVGSGESIFNAVRKGDWAAVELTNPLFVNARKNGINITVGDFEDVSKFGDEIAAGSADMPLSRGLQKAGVPRPVANAGTVLFQSRLNRDLRVSGDMTRRIGIARTQYDRELLRGRWEMVQTLDEIAKKSGTDPWELRAKFRALGEDVNINSIRDAFPDNPEVWRAWRTQASNIKNNTLKEANRLTFVGGRTKADEALSKVMFFHYWTSRAVALHVDTALKNPQLLRLYAEAYTNLREQSERLGLPSYLNAWVRFMGDTTGWMGFVNPLGMIVPLFMFTEMMPGNDEFGRSIGDYITDFGAMSPWVQGALGAMGLLSRAPDVTGTTGLRNIVRTVVNWARAEGIGPIDKYMSPAGDPVDSVLDDVFNWVSKNFGEKYIPGGHEIEKTDPRDTDLRQLNFLIDERMDQLYGPDWRDDPALVDMANDAKQAGESGSGDNPLWNSVYKQWTREKVGQSLVKMVVPGQSQFINGPQQEQRKLAAEGYDAINNGKEPTPEQQAAMDAQRDNGMTSDARAAQESLDSYYDIGTVFQRELNKYWTEAVYKSDTLPEGSWVVIDDTENYTVEEWQAMSVSERAAAMDRWVAAQGGTEQLAAYKTERDQYRTENPETDAYLNWRDAARGNDDMSEQTIHEEMMRQSPAYAEYINGLRDPNDPSGWWTLQAYFASIGKPYKLSDDPGDPLDPSQGNPMQAITGYMNQDTGGGGGSSSTKSDKPTYGSGNWATKKEWQQAAPAEYVVAMQQEYDKQVAEVQPVVDDVLTEGGFGSMVGMTYQELAETAATKGTSKAYDKALAAVKAEFYLLDIPVPSIDGEVKDYNRWKQDQLAGDPNADVSPQAYETAKKAGQAKYGVNQEAQGEADQAALNEARAQWRAQNPNGHPWQVGSTYPRSAPPPQPPPATPATPPPGDGLRPTSRYLPGRATQAAQAANAAFNIRG